MLVKYEPGPKRLDFNRSIRLLFQGDNNSADAGVLLLRELDDAFGLISGLVERLNDPRAPHLIQHPLEELLRTRLFALVQGYQSQDSVDALRKDPLFRLAASNRRGTTPIDEKNEDSDAPDGLASQPTQSRLVELLSSPENLAVLKSTLLDWAIREYQELETGDPIVLDIDSFPIEAHGNQPGSAWNGHYGMQAFHPLITMLAYTWSVVAADLRVGNAGTARGAVEHLRPVIRELKERIGRVDALRGDAGFPCEDLFRLLEEEDVSYVLRLRRNAVLDRLAEPYLNLPFPGTDQLRFHELTYRAKSWSRERRVVLVVISRPDELFNDYFFLVTGYTEVEMEGSLVLDFYRERGSMEDRIGEFKSVMNPALSSASRQKSQYLGSEPKSRTGPRDAAKANEVTLLLNLLGFNLGNMLRNLAATLSEPGEPVARLARVRSTLLKVAVVIKRSARRVLLLMNQNVRNHWCALLRRIQLIGQPLLE